MRVLRSTTLAAVGMAALLAGSAQARSRSAHNTRGSRQARAAARQAQVDAASVTDKVINSAVTESLANTATEAIDSASPSQTMTTPDGVIPDELPKVEDLASAFLSASGVTEKLKAANAAPAGGFQTDSAVWSAFLNAAANNLQGGSMEQYASSFVGLRDGDMSSILNTAVPGEEVSADSLLTLKLGADFNKQYKNIKSTMQLAFGIDPEDNMSENVGDPAWWARTLIGAVQGKGGAMSLDCAWTASADYQTANLFFPDSQSVYHLMFFPQFGPSDLALIEGEFPDTRYFSVQTYDESFSTVAGLQDAEIEPFEGVNSFAKKTPMKLRDGKFKIVLSKDGKRGFPNELPMAVGNFSSTGLGFVIFRMYGIDPEADTKDATLKRWGYKSPPTISLRTAGSLTPATFDQGWKTLKQCEDSNTEIANDAVNTAVNTRLVELNYKEDAVSCKLENVKDGFMLMSRERSSSSRSPFMNADAAYLMACANSRPDYIKNNELIAVVKSYFPSTPYSKFAARFIGSPETYDMRYASLSVYDLQPPGPVLKTFSDAEIRNFYYTKYGAETWEETYQRNVSLVVSSSAAALARCKMDTSDSLVLTLDSVASQAADEKVPNWWSIVYRELIPQGSVINATNAASYGMKAKDIYDKSILDARNVMCTDNESCDKNPYRAASIMKEHFPRVEWYTCSPNGVLAVADPVVDFEFDTRFDSKALAPRSEQYFYQFCPEDVNQALVKVLGPSTVTLHAANEAATSAPANTLATRSVTISNKKPSFVVGVSIKARDPIDAYFKAEVEVCGYSYITDPKWTCIAEPPADDAWLTAEFDDSQWERASYVDDDYHVPAIADEAKYITLGEGATGLYCRLVVPNPTYMG